jgi:F0F1-type ATP synthase assembly protein I
MVVGSEMAAFTVLGLLLDFGLGTIPWLTVVFTLLGVAVAFFHLVKITQSLAGKPKPPDSANEGTP